MKGVPQTGAVSHYVLLSLSAFVVTKYEQRAASYYSSSSWIPPPFFFVLFVSQICIYDSKSANHGKQQT